MECLSGNSSGITKLSSTPLLFYLVESYLDLIPRSSGLTGLVWVQFWCMLPCLDCQIAYAQKQYGVILYDDVDAKIFSRKEIFNGFDWVGFLWLSRRAFNW